MARVTVEDCLSHEENRFSLVILAAKRTRQIMKGSRSLVHSKNRAAVTALREIAAGKFQIDDSSVTGDDRWLPSHRQPEGHHQRPPRHPPRAAPDPQGEPARPRGARHHDLRRQHHGLTSRPGWSTRSAP